MRGASRRGRSREERSRHSPLRCVAARPLSAISACLSATGFSYPSALPRQELSGQPPPPLHPQERKTLDYLYGEWSHPYFISIEEYGRIMKRTGVLDQVRGTGTQPSNFPYPYPPFRYFPPYNHPSRPYFISIEE
jgi:hypothetical protein